MSAPPVTVLMAVHDGERHVRESVESILGQTHGDFELLVVDDASTDSSRAIVESYGDPRLRVLVNERNLGLTSSLNRGLRETRSRYVARQDADDVSEPHRLERQVELLERRPEVALVASHYRRIDDEGRHVADRRVPTDALAVRWRLLFLNAFTHSSVTFRRDAVLEIGGYDERFAYAQDYDLWSRLAGPHALAAVPEILVSYRRSSDSMTATYEPGGDEIRAIVARNLGHLGLGLDDVDVDGARRVLFGDVRSLEPARATAVVESIIETQEAFARAWGLDPRTAARHRAEVARALGSQLIRLGLARRRPRAVARGMKLHAAAALAGYARG